MSNRRVRAKAIVDISVPTTMGPRRWMEFAREVVLAIQSTELTELVTRIAASPISVTVEMFVPWECSNDALHDKLNTLAIDAWKRCGDDLEQYIAASKDRVPPLYERIHPEGMNGKTFNLRDAKERERCDVEWAELTRVC